jgi:CMP-N-acetylneuraminic acid synthetase
LRSLGGYNENYKCQDGYELWVKFIQHFKVKNLNEALFSYRQHGVNLTSNENRILDTRAQINADYIASSEIMVDTIAIIPVRTIQDKFQDLKINGKSLLNIKIEQALAAKNIKKVILACKDLELLDEVVEVNKSNKKFSFYQRSENSIRYNETLSTLIKEVFNFVGREIENISSTVILDLRFPLISAIKIDDAINTMHLFKSDSLISVRNFPNTIFQHDGSGMKAIMGQDKFTKLEREQLYEHVGGITTINNQSFMKSGVVVSGKVGHIILDKRSSMGVEDETDLKVMEILTNS